MSISAQMEERPLHEIYLATFEKIVKESDPRGIMCAYNGINGTFCAENKELLTDILRKKWGYRGIVVTDWVKGVKAG